VKPEVYYRAQNSSPLLSILSQINQIQIIQNPFLEGSRYYLLNFTYDKIFLRTFFLLAFQYSYMRSSKSFLHALTISATLTWSFYL
jgi:hypothetical protein